MRSDPNVASPCDRPVTAVTSSRSKSEAASTGFAGFVSSMRSYPAAICSAVAPLLPPSETENVVSDRDR